MAGSLVRPGVREGAGAATVCLAIALAAASCASLPTVHKVEIAISANQAVSVAWREPMTLYEDWGCAPTVNAYDPRGAGSEWFAEIGVAMAMDGWAVIDQPNDICWFHFSFVFASPADWNTYVPEWPSFLADPLPFGAYFYPVPTPGSLAVATLGDGAIEATLGTEVVVADQAEAQS
ncbi:hypothetical protein IIA16_02365, partial [bacterium]|nr:hypothetical protein [bacterium]